VSRIAAVTKVDNYTVNIRFTEAFSGNMYALCFPLISSAYYAGDNVLVSEKNLKPLGNSVYAFDSFIRAKELVLTSIENSFSTKPLINKIVVNITTDVDTDIYSFSQRISDAVIADNSLLGTVNLEDGAKKYSYIDNTYEFLGFNFDNEILSDKNIRKAIAYAIPTENIIESIYLSHATNTETPLNPKSWLKTQREATYGYNLNTAREYLNTAGFVRNESIGIREKTVGEETQRLTFSILVNEENEERIRIATRIADELNGIGFTVSVERVDFDTFVSRLEKGEFEMFLGGWQLSIVPQFNFMFASSANNYINYNSEKMNQLLYNYYQATTDQAMVLAMESLETEIIEELPYISLVFLEAALFVDKRISGAVEPIQYNGFRNIENWYIQ
ncbi:MAG: ABC transporter substrate-binding protein, partial [Anaerotignaceae bacterium]